MFHCLLFCRKSISSYMFIPLPFLNKMTYNNADGLAWKILKNSLKRTHIFLNLNEFSLSYDVRKANDGKIPTRIWPSSTTHKKSKFTKNPLYEIFYYVSLCFSKVQMGMNQKKKFKYSWFKHCVSLRRVVAWPLRINSPCTILF